MSHRIAAKITGVAGCVPPKVLTNADLEKMVATNDEWIRTRTGIRERHIVEKGTPTSHLAVEAAKILLTQTKTDPSEIDMIVLATVTPDMMFPATACLVQDQLGAKNAWGFDLSAACAGFAYALDGGLSIRGGRAQEGAGDRQRHDELHHRLQGSRDRHSVWRWRGRGAAGTGGRQRRHPRFFS